MSSVAVLTERMVRNTLRSDLPFAVLAPAGNFIIFNLALRNVIDTGGIGYPQYLLPVIIVQVTLLGALTTVDRATRDHQSELGLRFRTMPIATVAPLTARMLYCLIRGMIALVATIVAGYLFGFRMLGGPWHLVAFISFVLALTLALSLAADATGVGISASPIGRNGGSSQVLLVPQMMLVMLSTGMAPVDSFPEWLHGFVRYQPVSQVTETLRGLAAGNVAVSSLASSFAWCLGLLALFGVIAVRMQRRTQ
ncbi:ABC-2 type transport system permease protein [Mycolicibacterium sp. BK556]|uniref:ABC transporter permease n=1 Tax=Mycobacteriaceae TaxID=1762 RepID=UPI0010E63D4F|nr:ABC transporter permease [Mycobacterium sp. BK086]MBB3606942.1 ABC-2 type transport system permease protein [Mycolicibacterium sp. BK556]MBB3636699.1 ABC-2 type transport system permease protein [Mycolicibacterium sp. BK607]MBB3752998.1 ABC-2 type transport system permease protein [Mycolicibacterium sp. BK634]TDO09234.1 ABC-2 type transport system permease protein [Mycobacterium sp. BK086]